MKEQITVTVNGKLQKTLVGVSISEIIKAEKLCGGHGKCGKCKVIAKGMLSALTESEKNLLSADEIARDTRLACSTLVMGECEITTLYQNIGAHSIVTDAIMPKVNISTDFKDLGVALDIGTTTLAARLYSSNGKLLSSAGALNPQSSFGADVISRIEASLAGHAAELASLVRAAIDELVFQLCRDANVSPKSVNSLVLTGNTAMLYFLTATSPLALSRAPFLADRLFGETISAQDLALSSIADTANVYLPPCISAFVGADTVCALLSTELCNTNQTRMLVDIGTNGEMALWHNNKLSTCSTAAGPAFEGVGISCGMRGEAGAIDKISIVNGTLYAQTVGNLEPRGICGSGIVDAAACMLELELMDETGFLEDGDVILAKNVVLTQNDVRALQLAKSAIYSGLCTLVNKCNTDLANVTKLYVAGGFGRYLNMHSATRIGLLPEEMSEGIEVVGNAALAGASMLLLNSTLREQAENIAKNAEGIELASDPVFAELYMSSMLF
jgi:uncharacterized 2Fe-2S/4Fe-4S cluster protein (DUF4445 family)